VVVTLKHPDASWVNWTAYLGFVIFEKKFQQEHKATLGHPGTLVMGTGPWKYDSLDPTRGIEMSANPNWWGGKVPVQHISFKFFSDETSEALAFRAGDLDVVPSLQNPTAFAAASDAKIIHGPSLGEVWVSFPTQTPPWSDIHVRRAVAYALNRTALIKADGNTDVASDSFIPPRYLLELGTQAQVNKVLQAMPHYPFSIAKAKAELAKSAYPNGFTAELPQYAYGSIVNVSQVAIADLKQIGINLQLTVLPNFGAWYAKADGPVGKRFLTISCCGGGSYDPSNNTFLLGAKNIPTGGFNFSEYGPPAVDRLMKDGLTTTAPSKRLAIYGQLLKRIATDLPYMTLWDQTASAALSSKFTWPTFDALAAFSRPWPLELKTAG
jgi:peptide/nickel transport system substrate-binding protein